MKRVFIVHKWDGTPEKNWLPWIKKELEAKGFLVIIPAMPNTEAPKMGEWIPYLKKIAKKVDKNTYFIGHSMGCQTILRFLQDLPEDEKIGGAVLVAGFVDIIKSSIDDEEKEIARPWLETPISWDKIINHTNKFIAIFSDNDPYVDMKTNSKIFKEKLSAKVIVEHSKGHMNDDKLPSALNSILEISK